MSVVPPPQFSSTCLLRTIGLILGTLALVVAPLTNAKSVRAQEADVFFPVASGIVELGRAIPVWHVAELDLPEREPFADPASGAPGFLLVSEGVVLVDNDLTGHRTFVQASGAIFISPDDVATFTALEADAIAWRIAVVPQGAEAPLSRGNGVSRPQSIEGAGDDSAPENAIRSVEIRVGALSDGEDAAVGDEFATAPLVCSLLNRVIPGDGESIREGRCGASSAPTSDGPLFVRADDGDAIIAVVVVGSSLDPDSLESVDRDDASATTQAASGGGGSSAGDSGSGNQPSPQPTSTQAPDLTDLDTDGDGLNDQFELDNGTDVNNPDSDGDGLNDRQELIELGLNTDPNNPDTDGDGNSDGFEVNGGSGFITRPDMTDTDGDGAGDGGEFTAGLNPTNPDTDGDGMLDGEDFEICDAFIPDTDGDGWLDGQEQSRGTDCQEIDPFP